MTVTINYTAFLMTIVSVIGVGALAYFIYVLTRVSRTIGRLEATIDQAEQMLGAIKTLSEESTATVIVARQLFEQGTHVVEDFTAVSTRMRHLAESETGRALSLIDRLKSYVAIFAGVKTAIASFKHFMGRRRHPSEGYEEH